MENVNSQIKKVRKYYGAVQESYDMYWMNKKNLAMHLGFWDEDTDNLHEALINENQHVADYLEINKDDTVLDAGCGVGGTVIWIAENYGAKAVGINVVNDQVEAARRYANERKLNHLTSFKVRDFADTGLSDNSFTKAYSIESICHSPEKENVLKEIYRLLKPGGKFVFIDAFLNMPHPGRKEKKWIYDWCEGWACPDIPVLSDFLESFSKAGFKVINDVEVTEKSLPCSKLLYEHCKQGYLRKSILSRFGIISQEDYWNTRASISQHLLYRYGVISHHLLVAQK